MTACNSDKRWMQFDAVKLMAGVHGESNAAVSGVDLTFSDAATNYLPNSIAITNGTYKPSDFRVTDSGRSGDASGPVRSQGSDCR